jgi:aspartate/methionine/tyrosine aminotransferase
MPTRNSARSGANRIADPRVSDRVQSFPESVIREMTRIAAQYGALNLAQGFPDFDPPKVLLRASKRALEEGANQYSVTWGTPELRAAIARKAARFNRIPADPETNVVVTCGATEAMMAAMLAVVNPGEEVVVFQPFYENYGPDAIVSGARPRHVTLEWPDWALSEEALKGAFGRRTKAVVVNTPNNPTGKVFSRRELRLIADLCVDYDVVAITDEIYEHMVYDGASHVSLGSLPGMADRTITIDGISKTYSATGWRVGWALAPTTLAAAMRRAHDFLTVCAPHVFQVAATAALGLPPEYYRKLATSYERKRDRFVAGLRAAGFRCSPPQGTYYVMTDFSDLSSLPDREFALALVRQCGVASVPGSSFYSPPELGARFVRFAFSKTDATLASALERLEGARGIGDRRRRRRPVRRPRAARRR